MTIADVRLSRQTARKFVKDNCVALDMKLYGHRQSLKERICVTMEMTHARDTGRITPFGSNKIRVLE